MEFSVITVTWNSEEYITEQIRSVNSACKGLSYEHIIVDNASTDGTTNLIEKEFPNCKLLKNKNNIGFGKANNMGANMATGDFLFFLNPDMKLTGEDDIKKWIVWMRGNPHIGISGCKLVANNAEVNLNAGPRRFPRIFDQLMILLKIPHLFPSVLNSYLYKGFNFEVAQKVDSVRGSCLLMRRDLYEKMGFAFDPRYFIWFEDVDTCREAYRHGYEVWYTPIASAIDLVGKSFKKRNFLWKQWNVVKSMITYFSKWGLRV